ncbi:MAG: sigma-54-dependent Fis family transcriptional regulator, partial [Myxococcales bacterium]|nr:sigma-54-dependent Fis family transcriptional regulator [Myxococcales bacterium]
SGVGKERVARLLHANSPRRERPFVAVNCAALSDALLEAELFGHVKGAFTGADKPRAGLFEQAEGGTLFLDEVGDASPRMQAELLRVLEEGEVRRVGDDRARPIDVRVISATHQDLEGMVAEGRFREDLLYRVNVVQLRVPPLRERRGDLPLLTEHFLGRYAKDPDTPPSLSPRAWAALTNYDFPGNVRELEHAVQHAVVLSRGHEIQMEHLPRDIVGRDEELVGGDDELDGNLQPLQSALRAFEREYLLRALKLADGKKMRAARMLGISRKNLWEKLKSHQVGDDEDD